jgi:NHLM bacteriocin system ABC transporter ATP-binding protein
VDENAMQNGEANRDDLKQRVEAQQRITRQMRLEALESLGQTAMLPALGIGGRTDAAFLAVNAVARVLELTIHAPREFEQDGRPARREDPYEAIARANHLRIRPVRLQADWWHEDYGPLLTYLKEDQRPAALLPCAGGRYEVFDPTTGERRMVGAADADRFERRAFTLYRPLPVKPLGNLDLMRFALAGRWKELGGLIFLGVVISLLGMASVQAIGLIVDHAIPDADRLLLAQIALGLLAVAAGITLAETARSILAMRVETGADHALQSAAWDRLLRLRLPFFRKFAAGDLLTRVSAINGIRQALSAATLRTLFASCFGLLNLGLLWLYNAQLALVGTGIACLMAVITIVAGVGLRRYNGELLARGGRLMGSTIQLLQMVSKLRAAAAEERAYAFWMKNFLEQKQLGLRVQAIQDWVGILNSVVGLLATIALFATAVPLTQASADKPRLLTTGDLMVVLAAYWAFLGYAGELSNSVTRVLHVLNLWERVQPILKTEPETNSVSQDPGPLQGAVHVENLDFRYREDGPLVLSDVSLQVEPGEFVAIAGVSGSGKSTLLRLLLGFEQPEAGRLLFDGHDLSGLDLHAIRRQLGVVLQNGRLQQGSIFENIAGGALISLEQAEAAAAAAGLADDLAQMPMGLHTIVSEGGTNLSGGQRQRILIARALAGKPRILLFDEATSSLDNRTQAQITQHLKQLQVTRIVIAHRLSTIRQADRIYVLDKGKIVQQGTFPELAAQPGIFAQFVERQRA